MKDELRENNKRNLLHFVLSLIFNISYTMVYIFSLLLFTVYCSYILSDDKCEGVRHLMRMKLDINLRKKLFLQLI